VQLTWHAPARRPNGVEVQRLQPTYIGSRFERIALLPGTAASFVDDQPLNGMPTVYRVRALFDGGASDYSNHVHQTAPASAVALESQDFEKPPRDLGDEFRNAEVAVVADPANPGNRVMHVHAHRPAGVKEFRALARWTASPRLFDALNASVGRERGTRPDIYRMQLKVRFLQARVSAGSEVSLQVDPGTNLFATPGRRQNLIALADAKAGRPQGAFANVSFDFAALPNGAGAHGLQQYRATPPTSVAVTLPIDLRGDGDDVEFLIDDLTISRLDAPTGVAQ
jgi:hypothetical protein